MRRDYTAIFVNFFCLLAFAQTIIITVSPLKAYDLLGTAQAVSLLYVVVGVVCFLGRLFVPLLIRTTSKRHVFVFGISILMVAAPLLAAADAAWFVLGLMFHSFAFACLEIVVTILMLDHVPRLQLTRFETRRVLYSAAAWSIAPWLGVFLKISLAEWVPFAVQGATAALLLAYFFCQSLGTAVVQRTNPKLGNFSSYVPHFFAQPRLRLAWGLASGRASWWAMFFVYAPIFAVASGLGEQAGGFIVSAGTVWIWLVPLWGRIAQRVRLRRFLIAAYLTTGVFTISTAALTNIAWAGASMLVLAALFAAMIDAAGNSLFLRAVRSYERSEMTAVYISYRDMAQMAPPAVFSILLASFSLSAVFLVGGVMMLMMGGIARYVPRGF